MSRATTAREGVWSVSCALMFLGLMIATLIAMPAGSGFAPMAKQSSDRLRELLSRPEITIGSVRDAELAMSPRELLDRWNPLIEEASEKFGVPKAWIRAVISRESGGRTVGEGDAPITSPAGAMGLMQIMPDTYAELAEQYGLGPDVHDPRDNIYAGTAYLSWLKSKYGFPNMFSAYNFGPGNYERHMAGKSKLPEETVNYVAFIRKQLGKTKRG